MDLAVPVYIYIRLTFLQIYLANTNRFPFNVINWAGETLHLKKWNKCKCFLLSKIIFPLLLIFSSPIFKIRKPWREKKAWPVITTHGYSIITQIAVLTTLRLLINRITYKVLKIRKSTERKKSKGGPRTADGDQSTKEGSLELLYSEGEFHRQIGFILYQFRENKN